MTRRWHFEVESAEQNGSRGIDWTRATKRGTTVAEVLPISRLRLSFKRIYECNAIKCGSTSQIVLHLKTPC